ncbi:MAG: relaxase domain-containing protein [Solirubrobacterales bacterium]
MTASSIPAARGGVYARYLEGKTVEPERGDYYLTPDGEMAQAPGRWLTRGETLERLGVQAGEPVAGGDFIAVMEGRHPGSGEWLRPEGAGGGRGGGIDVTFSAPKSVSVAWALGDAWQREQIEAAHARAVEQAVLYLREQTSKESAYVEATRARHGTDWYLARDDLGAEGQDEQRILKLAGKMRQSRTQTPSLTYREPRDPTPDRNFEPTHFGPERFAPWLDRDADRLDRRELDRGHDIDRGR